MRQVVEVVVDALDAELASDALWQAGASAVGEQPVPGGRVRLTADVEDPAALDPRWPATVRVVDEAADLDAWRRFARPVRAGRRVVLCPAWAEPGPVAADDLVLRLDPGRAFGSGSHPATRLAVAALEAHVRPGATVLDVGCGSGVLAVAAVRLGADRAVAVDIDPAAVAATVDNASRNGVGGQVDASTTPLEDVTGLHDVVVANIGIRVLVDHAAAIEARVAPGGTLVLSGLLAPQGDAAVSAYPGRVEVARLEEDGWVAPVLRRLA